MSLGGVQGQSKSIQQVAPRQGAARALGSTSDTIGGVADFLAKNVQGNSPLTAGHIEAAFEKVGGVPKSISEGIAALAPKDTAQQAKAQDTATINSREKGIASDNQFAFGRPAQAKQEEQEIKPADNAWLDSGAVA